MTELMFKPGAIPKQVTLRESAAQILLAQIMSGELKEGEIYSVAMVASNLGISPTPVREAVLELADKGLLTVHKNRGFTVPVLTRSMMEEIHHIRFLLEAPSTVRAGMMLGDADVAELREIAEMTVEDAEIPRTLVAQGLERLVDAGDREDLGAGPLKQLFEVEGDEEFILEDQSPFSGKRTTRD